jgi:glycosyltransferase involved in cell wall biosynthesis
MKPNGGTEILFNNFLKYVDRYSQDTTNIILVRCDPTLIDPTKTNIVWQHVMTDQGVTIGMDYPEFVDNIDHFVYLSNWQLNKFKEKFNIEHCNNHVIKNAIPEIEFIKKPTDKIRLIYTSMPFRGLNILLDAFELINRNDVELHVYSSNIIYGIDFSETVGDIFEPMFHRCKTMKNVVYKGYATNKEVHNAVQQAHILAYPSIFEETSCLSAIEPGAAGCKIVTTDYGALRETCGDWASYIEFTNNSLELVHNYAELLQKEIDNYLPDCYNAQSKWFNDQYSWNNRAVEWNNFLGKI